MDMKITIRLRPVKDDDIKEWYKDLPSGDRSRVIRNVLKEAINCDKSGVQDYYSDQSICSLKVSNEDIEFKSTGPTLSKEDIDSKLNSLLGQI